jgi:hypothetical protein
MVEGGASRFAVVERTCPSCGRDPGAGTFCQHCGTRLTDDAAAAPPPEETSTPPVSTPPQIPGQQQPSRRRGLSGCLIVVIVLIVLLVVGGFLVWRYIANEVLPGVEGTAGQFMLSEAPPGPCYDLTVEDGLLAGWDEVSCDGPRDAEVSFAAAFEEGPFPGDDYLATTAAETCRTAFESYVGISPERSAYDVDWLVPTEAMWADGIRNGICLVVADDRSTLTGTVKGSET